MTKEQIIGGTNGFWFFRMSHQYEGIRRKFILYILEKENISYIEKDLDSFLNQGFRTDQLLLSYIYRYADLFSREHPSKENIEAMHWVKQECIRCKKIDDSFSDLFNSSFKNKNSDSFSEEIKIKRGNSITFENGVLNHLKQDELEQLLNVTFQEVEKPKSR